MGEYTKNLQLYKVDTVEDANNTFNIETMLNDNWDKIDEKLEKLPVQNGGLYINSETTAEDKAEAQEALYDLGMAGTHNHVIKTFGDVTEIGLTRGSETIEDIASKLPPFSMLQMTINSETNNTIYPNSGYGQLFVRKGADATRTFFEHYSKDTGLWYYGWYKGSWSGWIECGNPAGYFPLDGSVSTSGKYLNLYNGYCLLKTDENSVELTTKNAADSNANMRTLSLLNGSYMENVVNSLKLNNVVNGTHKYYNIFGEHNKPSGSYTGNGSATAREITVNSIRSGLLIVGSNGTSAIVTSSAGVKVGTSSISRLSYDEAHYHSSTGVLTIKSTDASLNANGVTYEYFGL